MITITKLKKISGFAPSQWLLTNSNGEEIYVRYRRGKLSIELSDETVLFDSDFYSSKGDNVLTTRDMINTTVHILDFVHCYDVRGLDHWDLC